MFILEFDILKSTVSCKLTGLTSLETWDQFDTTYKTITFSYVPNLVLVCSKPCDRGKRKEKVSSMVKQSSSAWRLLRTMNIFMFTDNSSLEVSFLGQKEMLLA